MFLIAAASGSAVAHHSPVAFDLEQRTQIRGEVTRYVWRNPHVYIYVDGTDDAGTTTEWQIEGDPTPLMTRSGWSATTLAPGDVVSLEVHPDRNSERHHGLLATLTTPAGITLGLRTDPSEATAAASSIAGVWDALPNFPQYTTAQVYDPNRAYTQAGLEARAAYNDTLYPPSQCVAFATPLLMVLPYLVEIETLEDHVLIRSEFYSVERVVYTDGRGHPENGERTIQGHSIGHWEGTTLVVDTRLFAELRLANGPGVPSGHEKHTVERFKLSEDRTQLELEILVEDPEFVVEPFTIQSIWNYAPQSSPQPFGCDPESARMYYMHE